MTENYSLQSAAACSINYGIDKTENNFDIFSSFYIRKDFNLEVASKWCGNEEKLVLIVVWNHSFN